MTTNQKAQKDKPHGSAPRLAPRPTAASAARAARNATNRNLLPSSHSQRQSPPRASTATLKGKSVPARISTKCDSKTDLKINRNLDNEIPNNVHVRQQPDVYIVETSSVIIAEESKNEICYGDIEVHETDNFDDKCNAESLHDIGGEVADRLNEPLPCGRSHTPGIISRPQTPLSVQSSRPQTPRVASRPSTPAHPRLGTPVSRPNTPRLSTPTTPVHSTMERLSNIHDPAIKEDEDIKSIYTKKQNQFHRLKKELDLKQQAVLEVFDSLRGLRERMCQEGMSGSGEGLPQQELVVFNVADWTADELTQLCRDAVACAATEGAAEIISTIMPLDDCALAEVDTRMINLPRRFADLCLQAFTARQELIDWVRDLVEKHENGSDALDRIALYNAQGLQLCETLRELKSCADNDVDTLIQLSRRACRERSALVSVGESLVREIAQLRQDIEDHAASINDLQQTRNDSEMLRLLEDTRRDLEEERAARLVTKDKLSSTECQLRQTRMRVSKMDRQLKEAEASIASLTGTVKTLEDQSRQKEVHLEARARKLKECLKTGEVTSGQLAQQRDALQTEVAELKEHIENLNTQQKSTVHELTNQLKEIKSSLEQQMRITDQETRQKEAINASFVESLNTIEELKAKITELENSRPNPELPTEREMDLWAELQATKETLRMTEEEVTACKREKVRFLETMTKITEPDNKVGMQQKLAAELLSKEEIIAKMQIQIRDMTKTIKFNEQKVAQYEQYVRNLQAHNRAVANCQEAPNGISYQDLQQEIMNLRMSLLEAGHRNDELTELLMQKEQHIEQQDKTSRAQARVIKVVQVREELINMLKNKETEQSRELSALQQDLEHRMSIVGEVNKQIAAKAEEIQELFATLENKQQQIHRMEKIVVALEEQQRRAQAQRTRHEEKIAALEHELAASGNRRERKFLFF